MKAKSETVEFWNARAEAYDRNTRDWGIFPAMSQRLVEAALPEGFSGQVLDLGAGTGATSETILELRPQARVALLDPSSGMLALAQQRLGSRARIFCGDLSMAIILGLRADAVLCSAAMHYLEFEPTLSVLSQVLKPRGVFAFNLWWHNWAETEHLPGFTAWKPFAEQACAEAGLKLSPGVPPARQAKTRAILKQASEKFGFDWTFESLDHEPTPLSFSVAFQAMSPQWPVAGLAGPERERLLARINELGQGQNEDLVSLRFVFKKS